MIILEGIDSLTFKDRDVGDGLKSDVEEDENFLRDISDDEEECDEDDKEKEDAQIVGGEQEKESDYEEEDDTADVPNIFEELFFCSS